MWDLDTVLVSPHPAYTLASENTTIVDLFGHDLRRFLDGTPLRNRYDRTKGY